MLTVEKPWNSMDAAAWTQLADHSRALVHHTSRLMGALTLPARTGDEPLLRLIAADAAEAVDALLCEIASAPELAAHARTIERFDGALAAWRRAITDASPLARRYQTALLQQAAQVMTSCLHVESLANSESARVFITRRDVLAAPERRRAEKS
jgi:hypothetical protein